jgi:protein TonB
MLNKKSKNADLESKRGILFLFGLIISLGLVLLAFQWKTLTPEIIDLGTSTYLQDDVYYIPPTPAETKKVPPKPVFVPGFVLVDNNSAVNDNPDLFTSEEVGDEFFSYQDFNLTGNPKNEKPDEEIFLIAEEMPEFPGGNISLKTFLAKNVEYPIIARENGIQGKVYVRFVIDKNGEVTHVEIYRGVETSLDKEALRVVGLLPKWKPGKQGGKAVNVSYVVPINFELR